MPSLSGATSWLNSPPLTPEALRGKVVLIDFWTYSCINCLRTLPYVKAWYAKYKDHGLVVLGVHSPEFAFEKDPANVRRAVSDLGVQYPVALDDSYGAGFRRRSSGIRPAATEARERGASPRRRPRRRSSGRPPVLRYPYPRSPPPSGLRDRQAKPEPATAGNEPLEPHGSFVRLNDATGGRESQAGSVRLGGIKGSKKISPATGCRDSTYCSGCGCEKITLCRRFS